MRISYNDAVREGVYPNPKIGSTLEHEIATSLNLDSCSKNRSAVASTSVTQFKIGKQTAALSKAIIADKLDRIEEVLVFRNLDMMPVSGDFNAKMNSVTEYFGFGGKCVLKEVKEFYALSTDKKIVYVRFLNRKAKFTAERQLKTLKSKTPTHDSMWLVPTLKNSALTSVRAEMRLGYSF